MLNDESKEQMRHVKIGMANTLGEMNFLRQFLSWHNIMKLI
jgi:hypothetical protein